MIITNRTGFDIKKAKISLSKWLEIDYGNIHKEMHYSFIKRKVFAEEYIGKDLNNYKFFCCNGIPRYVYIHQEIDNKKYRTFFDMNWNKLDFICDFPNHPTAIELKPKYFELMKQYAKKLSHPFIFVRVDFYEFNDKIRLGEMTFTPMNGDYQYQDKKHNIELGKYIKIY